MEPFGISLFGLASDRMGYLGMRHKLIAENIANANTPGFASQDLKPFDQELKAAETRLAQTHEGHFQLTGSSTGRLRVDGKSASWEIVPSGNSVSMEQEMLKASETVTSHALVTNVYKSSFNLLGTALSGPR
ncbi:flagellar basal body rod protein FlgB [Tepidicaulis sp. LMO-SS28]|uniref:flagellar basal body rod protein FlgB n=1 Tax=Tepidicaulis sp. LMO-SS28 TaxID=3447455 RepID=UPI003EE031A8